MAARSSPINIANQPYTSFTSPRQQQASNLTSALHSTNGNGRRPSNAANVMNGSGRYMGNGNGQNRHDSVGTSSGLAPYGGGAQPISMSGTNRNQNRRESMASSMANGMSWGGVSVGSWIRDDVIMQGTSPFPHKSPSFHSSSYMPKLEATFMRDFYCCNMVLATLHDLLQHYEESHAQGTDFALMQQHQIPQNMPPPDPKAAIAANTATAIRQQLPSQPPPPPTQQQQQCPPQQQQHNTSTHTRLASHNVPSNPSAGIGHNYQPSQFGLDTYGPAMSQTADMDVADDMEMDDFPASNFGGMNMSQEVQGMFAPVPASGTRTPQQTHFGQPPVSRVPPLDMQALHYGNTLYGHQGLKNSQPGTPISGGRPRYQNNPTVSSVNTPTLSTHPRHQQQFCSPESSAPGTPGELDPEFVGTVGNMSMANNGYGTTQYHQSSQQLVDKYGYGSGTEMQDLCIDEPAKRLYSPGGGLSNAPHSNHQRLGSAQYGPNSDIARRIREQQVRAGLPDTMSGLNNEEPKPFRCPVIGCEKAYKNQNGLKYHKAHGHNNQQLHGNKDGTFSIVDPTTRTPYPGTLGMEKEKPYKCQTCGKRYKNLNGLKYHNSHSQPCNPDLQRPGLGIARDKQDIKIAGIGMGSEMR